MQFVAQLIYLTSFMFLQILNKWASDVTSDCGAAGLSCSVCLTEPVQRISSTNSRLLRGSTFCRSVSRFLQLLLRQTSSFYSYFLNLTINLEFCYCQECFSAFFGKDARDNRESEKSSVGLEQNQVSWSEPCVPRGGFPWFKKEKKTSVVFWGQIRKSPPQIE